MNAFDRPVGYNPHARPMPAIDPRMSLSPHFNLREFTKSQTAEKYQLYNIPREEAEIANLKALATHVLEPVRALTRGFVVITSGFRCVTLNRLVGGAVTSQHLYGEAADIIVRGMPVFDAASLIHAAADTIPFDQLIYEARLRDDVWTEWMHISHRRLGLNRRETLSILQDDDGRRVTNGLTPAPHLAPYMAPCADGGGGSHVA
jgi:hypothetical protein